MLFGMSRRAASIVLTPEEVSTLERWSRARSIPARLVQRARIVRLAAQGRQSQDIAEELDISRPTVQLWRQRFLALRLAGLEKDAPRPGRRPRIPPQKMRLVVEATLHSKPSDATHCTRTMARAQGLSAASVRRIWKQHRSEEHTSELQSRQY